MNENEIEQQEQDHFEGCPTCGQNDGYINSGSSHWRVCDAHKKVWFIGINLFSSWKEETEAEQRASWEKLDGYEVLIPSWASEDRPVGCRMPLPVAECGGDA